MNTKFISMTNAKNIKELKNAYKDLAFRYHPDMGGNTQDMQELNNLYASMLKELKKHMNINSKEYEHASQEIPSEFIKYIMDIINIKGLDIEIIGYWIWLDTKKISKDDYQYLYNIGFRWSKGKKLMYRDTSKSLNDIVERKPYQNYKKKSLGDIKNVYGCIKVDTKNMQKQLG